MYFLFSPLIVIIIFFRHIDNSDAGNYENMTYSSLQIVFRHQLTKCTLISQISFTNQKLNPRSSATDIASMPKPTFLF